MKKINFISLCIACTLIVVVAVGAVGIKKEKEPNKQEKADTLPASMATETNKNQF